MKMERCRVKMEFSGFCRIVPTPSGRKMGEGWLSNSLWILEPFWGSSSFKSSVFVKAAQFLEVHKLCSLGT